MPNKELLTSQAAALSNFNGVLNRKLEKYVSQLLITVITAVKKKKQMYLKPILTNCHTCLL